MSDAIKPGPLLMLQERASVFWEQRNERERKMLTVGGVATAAALTYFILFAPALAGRVRLDKELPTLRQQAAEMSAMAAQVSAAGNSEGGKGAAPLSRESVEASLKQQGITTQSLSVSDGVVRFQANPVSFGALQSWLFEQQSSNQLSASEANITALTETDMVNANMTLRQVRSGE